MIKKGPIAETPASLRWKRERPIALQLSGEGKTDLEIATALGRSLQSLLWKFRHERTPVPKQDKRLIRKSRPRPSEIYVSSTNRITEEQEADREARYAAALLRTPTQQFFGDPPPGFSALDRQRAMQSGRS